MFILINIVYRYGTVDNVYYWIGGYRYRVAVSLALEPSDGLAIAWKLTTVVTFVIHVAYDYSALSQYFKL